MTLPAVSPNERTLAMHVDQPHHRVCRFRPQTELGDSQQTAQDLTGAYERYCGDILAAYPNRGHAPALPSVAAGTNLTLVGQGCELRVV